MADLAIDMAGAFGSVSLQYGAGDAARIIQRVMDQPRGQAECVMGMIGELFAEAGSDYFDLSSIYCVVGPGSFTGVRIGLALAKGLALAGDLPLLSAPRTLSIGQKFAGSLGEAKHQGSFVSVIDASRGGLFCQVFEIVEGGLGILSEPCLIEHGDAFEYCQQYGIKGAVGPGASLFVDVIGLEAGVKVLAEFDACAEDLFAVADDFFVTGDKVQALYLRAADAKPQRGKALQRSYS